MNKYILFLLIPLASACLTTATTRVSVLTISECELPCWNDITPGVTPPEEAKQILENTEGIGAANVESFYQLVEIHFSLFLEMPGLNPKIRGDIFSDGTKVTELWLVGNLNVTFDDIIQRIGEPEFVISMPFIGGGNTFVSVYPSKGVSFRISPELKIIAADTEISTLTLFAPTDYDRHLEGGTFTLGKLDASGTQKIMYPWEGYGNIEELYPPRLP
ncbi:MAG: hypothetical protein HND47_20000 [Chloroflexi bacterium]|nr:hypothetical protein [Chloroflexota bacterium]